MVVVLYPEGDVDFTVGRQVASYTYGTFDVIVPDDREQQEADARLNDGYIYRPTDFPAGRFDIGFVRADVTIDLNSGTSDLETVLDNAQKRVEGDAFFGRDISGTGLGRFVPGVDFDVGDLVYVNVWGSRIRLPVTSAELKGDVGWVVHVGGQLIADAQSRRQHNDELLRQIATEKRQRLRDVGAVDGKAQAAQEAAEEFREVSALEAAQYAWLANFRRQRTRYFATGFGSLQDSWLFDDGTDMGFWSGTVGAVTFWKTSGWAGQVKIQVMFSDGTVGFAHRSYGFADVGVEKKLEVAALPGMSVGSFFIDVLPVWPDAVFKAEMDALASRYRELR